MLINYPYKFRLEPTEEQEKKLYHIGDLAETPCGQGGRG